MKRCTFLVSFSVRNTSYLEKLVKTGFVNFKKYAHVCVSMCISPVPPRQQEEHEIYVKLETGV